MADLFISLVFCAAWIQVCDSWPELLCNWQFVSQSVSQSVRPSVLVSIPSVTLDQILAAVRQLRGLSHAVSSLTGGRVCLLNWPSTGVFITWPSGIF